MADVVSGGHLIDSSGADNLSATLNSNWVNIEYSLGIAIEVAVDNTSGASTGTAAGSIAVQVSNSGLNWTAVEFSDGTTSLTVSSGTDLDKYLDLTDLNGKFCRVVYTRTSGNGILDVWAVVRRQR